MSIQPQEALFHESFYDALRSVIQFSGGSKAVACKLWPEKTPDSARRLLLDCINENRHEKFSPEQVLYLLKLGRGAGCHAAINYLAREAGYTDPAPVNQEDAKERLQREYIDAVKHMGKLSESLQAYGLLKAVA